MESNKTVAIGCDHAGYELKEKIKAFLDKNSIEYKDYGTHSDESVDYPDFAKSVANSIKDNKSDLGILICGSGNGINIAANKIKGIRSALCWNREVAKLARKHNDANIIALPGRFISIEEAEQSTLAFLETEFEGGRHQTRVEKIENETSQKSNAKHKTA